MNTVSKILLYPFALVFGLITGFRNFLYDKKYFKSLRFDFPVISVGNLSMGGTGKTPHIEYLIFQLQYLYKVATLSRGYGRKGHGFVLADAHTPASQIGDEPRQFKLKYPETIVAVCEDRVLGIPSILNSHPETEVILLDDAFQHRGVRAGLSILITEYANLFTRDHLFPVGWLRESKKNYRRADMIIVSKCPSELSVIERDSLIRELKPLPYQRIYFSTLEYGTVYSFFELGNKIQVSKDTDVLLVCGIARFDALKGHLDNLARKVYVRDYKDHHSFDQYDLEAIRETFHNLGEVKKVLVTTEKDAARFEEHGAWFLKNKLEIFVQPIAVRFLFSDGERFTDDVLQFITSTKQKN
ncbi:MAG: tetraacyldisaccharide 4'-kinase [Bacteroidetes bacterium]|nr:tetraacyldisaccharide 4'-kinase [Bacteroidota bacterium]